MLVVFWLCYDIVLITRESEYIKAQLWSYEAPYARLMPKSEMTCAMKRAKALRVIEIPVGNFSDISIDLPIAIWDEILNQVLFLLSNSVQFNSVLMPPAWFSLQTVPSQSQHNNQAARGISGHTETIHIFCSLFPSIQQKLQTAKAFRTGRRHQYT